MTFNDITGKSYYMMERGTFFFFFILQGFAHETITHEVR